MVVCGEQVKVFNAENDYICEKELLQEHYLGSSWSPDGAFLALISRDKKLMIFDTHNKPSDQWKLKFDFSCDGNKAALSWGISVTGKLYYLAYGGGENKVNVIEIGFIDGCWETALILPCLGTVLAIHWRQDGILAIGCSNGVANIVDLKYLLTGMAVYQMDYKWQRQGITCSVLIQRKGENNTINVVRWLNRNATKNHVLLLGGSDGVVETIECANN